MLMKIVTIINIVLCAVVYILGLYDMFTEKDIEPKAKIEISVF